MEPQLNASTSNKKLTDIASYIDELYGVIINSLNDQKDFLQSKLQDWEKQNQNTNDSSHPIFNTNEKEILANIFQMHDEITLNMNEILQDTSSLSHVNDISDITYSMIKMQIQQAFNDINKNNPIVGSISNHIKHSKMQSINIMKIHEQNIDQCGLDLNYNFDSILEQLRSDIICIYDNVKLYFYQKTWKPVGFNAGRLTLYKKKSSKLQYLVFNSKNNTIYSFQPIDITNCDIKPQQQQSCVNWIASDWCKQGTHYPFCAVFSNNNDVRKFADFCHQNKIDDDTKQSSIVKTVPTLSQEIYLKKVYRWNIEKNKWMKLCGKSMIKIYKDEQNMDTKMVLIKHNNSVIIKHVVPNSNMANFKMDNSKLWCQWNTQTEDLIYKEALGLNVYFETKTSFDSFVTLFKTVST